MKIQTRVRFGLVALLLLPAGPAAGEQEVYHSVAAVHDVSPSDKRLAVQFDTTGYVPTDAAFLADHACLDSSAPVDTIARGFRAYAINSESDYASASSELRDDSTVNRCVPVYVTLADSSEFCVADLVTVQMEGALSRDSAVALLEAHALTVVDSSDFFRNLWIAALHDTVLSSPVPYADDLDMEDAVIWSAPTTYMPVQFASGPADHYYPAQYYLNNDEDGTVDIDAAKAWQIPLLDSTLRIAILDRGCEPHPDLPASRFVDPWNVYDGIPDAEPREPGDNHGMAVAGVLGACHDTGGVAGVFGSCKIIPVLINTPYSDFASSIDLAEGIMWANAHGARVIVGAWGLPTSQLRAPLEQAIAYVTDSICYSEGQLLCDTLKWGTGSVLVFAAGNDADEEYDLDTNVQFPASMDQVIAVGAVDSLGQHWNYSCWGGGVDLVAPSGEDGDGDDPEGLFGNVWTVDREGGDGWNPVYTGSGTPDDTIPYEYTSVFGGTSAAAAEVAGVVGLLMAKYPDFDSCRPLLQVREFLNRSAVDLGPSGYDPETGWGVVSALRPLIAVTRGDLNNDGVHSVMDVVLTVCELYRNMPPQGLHPGQADANCDGEVTVLDLVKIIDTAFRGEPVPDTCFIFEGYASQ